MPSVAPPRRPRERLELRSSRREPLGGHGERAARVAQREGRSPDTRPTRRSRNAARGAISPSEAPAASSRATSRVSQRQAACVSVVAYLLAASDGTGYAWEAIARDIGLVACDGGERGAVKRNAKMRTNEIATSQQRAPEDMPKEYPPLGFSRFVCVNFHPNAHGHATPSMPIMTQSRLTLPTRHCQTGWRPQ